MPGEEAVVIHLLQKKIIRKFQDQCATDPRQAQTLETLGVKNRKIAKGLIKKKVLVEVSNDRFYLDEDAFEQYARKKRRGLLIGILAALAFGLAAYLLNR